jgi:hypothetical protein
MKEMPMKYLFGLFVLILGWILLLACPLRTFAKERMPAHHAKVLKGWMQRHPKSFLDRSPSYRLATEADCECQEMIQIVRKSKQGDPTWDPYYLARDFNGDDIEDFAVGLVKTDPVCTSCKRDAVLVFFGPFDKQPIYGDLFFRLNIAGNGFFAWDRNAKSTHLVIGPFQSTGWALIWKKKAEYFSLELDDGTKQVVFCGQTFPLKGESETGYNKRVKCTDPDLTSLKPMAVMAPVDELLLVGTQVGDLAPLVEQKTIKSLFLRNNPIRDITPLGKLSSLEFLSLEGIELMELKDLSSLSNLKNAKKIVLELIHPSLCDQVKKLREVLTQIDLKVSTLDKKSRLVGSCESN